MALIINQIRPLGAFSDFVVESLPGLLATNPKSLPAIAESLVDKISRERLFAAVNELPELTRLDAKMLEAAIVHKKLVPPDNLLRLVETVSGNELTVMTYEEIVLANPYEDMRLFSDGPIAETERVFYRGNWLVEQILEKGIGKVRSAIQKMSENYHQGAYDSLKGIENDLQPMVETMRDLGRINREHFAYFRPFVSSHPVRGLKGPSGAFSGRFPLLELLARENIPSEYQSYLRENLLYFPSPQRHLIASFLEGQWKHFSLGRYIAVAMRPMLKEQYDYIVLLTEQYDYILSVFDRFRRMHMGTVRRQLPEVFQGTGAGTGGEEDVPKFLLGRIESLKP